MWPVPMMPILSGVDGCAGCVSAAAALEARDYRPLRFGRLREFVERESVFSWLILTPPILFLLMFLGYPFFYGVYLSFFRREVTGPGAADYVGEGASRVRPAERHGKEGNVAVCAATRRRRTPSPRSRGPE